MPLDQPIASRCADPQGVTPSISHSSIPITLALQGGGSLGAFGWGVLDQLLDTPQLSIAVVSGASAGALNGALVTQGLATGGRSEAKRLLETLWRRIAVASGSPDMSGMPWLFPIAGLFAPMIDAIRNSSRIMSRDQINPLGINPLAQVLDGLIDASVFGRRGTPHLTVAATRVRTGEPRLFVGAEVTVKALLASACLPQLFPPVEIDGDLYWDGGYASNPPIRALIEAGAPPDILVVRTTPVDRPEAPPTDAAGLLERTTEVSFGAALRQELGSLAFAQRVLAEDVDAPGVLGRLRSARLHMIGAEQEFRALPGGSRLDPSWSFLERMRALGHRVAEQWLSANLHAIGHSSSIDLAAFAGQQLPPFASATQVVEQPPDRA